jgi:hypothetical protein
MTRNALFRSLAIAGAALTLAGAHAQQNDWMLEDLRFQGGTLEEVVELLDAENGSLPVNVLYRNGAEHVQVDSIRLSHIEVQTAMDAVADISGLVMSVKAGGASMPVFILTKPGTPFSATQPQETDTHIIPLAAKLDLRGEALIDEVDVVVSAVELALTEESDPKPELKLHPQTGLLIVRGTGNQLQTVNEVVDQISLDYQSRSAEYYRLERERINAEAQLHQIEAELNTALHAYDLARKEHAEMSALSKSGAVSQREIGQIEYQLVEKEGQVRRLEIQLDAARRELDLLRTQAGATEVMEYARSSFFGAFDPAASAIRAIGRASQSAIEVDAGDRTVKVKATKAQHEAIRALLSAMEAARAN